MNRIERKLNKLDGVSAVVNYATEKATVDYTPMSPDRRTCSVPSRPPATRPSCPPRCRRTKAGHEHDDPSEDEDEDEDATLRRRPIVSAVLSLPELLLAMVPALQFDNRRWLSLQLATPVVIWGAWPFHQAAWANLKHAAATMDTLISVGVLAAWLWALYALFLGNAGVPGMRMPFELIPERGAGEHHIYLEIAAVVTTLVLLGRFFEARPKRHAGAGLKALLELGEKEVSMLDDDGHEQRIPVEQLRVGERFAVRPGEKVAPTVWSRRARRRWT